MESRNRAPHRRIDADASDITAGLLRTPLLGWEGFKAGLVTDGHVRVVLDTSDPRELLSCTPPDELNLIVFPGAIEERALLPYVDALMTRHPGAVLICVVETIDQRTALALVRMGVHACLLWADIEGAMLLPALHAVRSGLRIMSDGVCAALTGESQDQRARLHWEHFTARERAICQRLARGMTQEAIGEDLGVGLRTIERSVRHIKDVLGTDDMRILAAGAGRGGSPATLWR